MGTNPFKTRRSLYIDIRNPYFDTSPELQKTDFQAAARLDAVGNLPKKGVLKWHIATLVSAANAYINKAGTTQFRLRFKKDDDNDGVADYIKFYSGNAPAASHPQSIVEYYVP